MISVRDPDMPEDKLKKIWDIAHEKIQAAEGENTMYDFERNLYHVK